MFQKEARGKSWKPEVLIQTEGPVITLRMTPDCQKLILVTGYKKGEIDRERRNSKIEILSLSEKNPDGSLKVLLEKKIRERITSAHITPLGNFIAIGDAEANTWIFKVDEKGISTVKFIEQPNGSGAGPTKIVKLSPDGNLLLTEHSFCIEMLNLAEKGQIFHPGIVGPADFSIPGEIFAFEEKGQLNFSSMRSLDFEADRLRNLRTIELKTKVTDLHLNPDPDDDTLAVIVNGEHLETISASTKRVLKRDIYGLDHDGTQKHHLIADANFNPRDTHEVIMGGGEIAVYDLRKRRETIEINSIINSLVVKAGPDGKILFGTHSTAGIIRR